MRPGPVRRIDAVSPAAAAAGIRPGISAADAQAISPALVLVAAAPAADRALVERLADWCGHYTPWSATDNWADGHGLWLDLTGCAHLFGGEANLLEQVRTRLARLGLTARAAIADTPGAAWAWARHGRAPSILPPGSHSDALAPLPVAALRLDHGAVAALSGLGLRRIGDLSDLRRTIKGRAGLTARFGPQVNLRLDQALGLVSEPITPRQPPPAHSVHAAFAEPISRPEDVAAACRHLLGRLCAQLQGAGLGLRRLEVRALRVDGQTRAIAIGTNRPNRDPAHLARLLDHDLPALDAGFGIEALRLSASETSPQDGEQLSWGTGAVITGGDFDRLVDSLANRLGFDRVVRLVPVASHAPDRAVQAQPVAAPLPVANWPADRRRPLVLLDRPEPVDAVAPLPDAPPRLFRWRGAPHRVARADGAERIAGEWWHPGPPPPERDYYLVEDQDGRRFWLFRQGRYDAATPPRWFLHGFFP